TAACAALCNPFSGHLDRNQWPIDGNLRSRCSSALNTDHSFHSDLNAQGFVPNGCMDPGPGLPLASQGTNAITLNGSATATLDGADPTMVAIAGGFFDITAPFTTCNALQTTCPTQINQAEVVFADFTLDGHSIHGLTLKLDAPVLTPSGVLQGNHFLFTIPQTVTFDAIA